MWQQFVLPSVHNLPIYNGVVDNAGKLFADEGRISRSGGEFRRDDPFLIGIDPNPVSYIHSVSFSGQKRILVLTAPFLSMLQYAFEKTSVESVTSPLCGSFSRYSKICRSSLLSYQARICVELRSRRPSASFCSPVTVSQTSPNELWQAPLYHSYSTSNPSA